MDVRLGSGSNTIVNAKEKSQSMCFRPINQDPIISLLNINESRNPNSDTNGRDTLTKQKRHVTCYRRLVNLQKSLVLMMATDRTLSPLGR
jgi:hypothetical protein